MEEIDDWDISASYSVDETSRRSTSSVGIKSMAKASLRTAAIYCLALWAAIWLLFLLMRLSPFDIRGIPGIGMVTLIALALALVAPMVATVLAGAALIRQPRTPPNLLTFWCAIAALVGQVTLFLISRWL